MSTNQFDSPEESMFNQWCVEAKRHSILFYYQFHPDPIEIYPKTTYCITKHLKTKTKEVDYQLLARLTYTPDFHLGGNISQYFTTKDKLLNNKGELVPEYYNTYYIDVKGTFSKFGDSKQFSIIQKALYHSRGIYVNKLVPERFFKNAWVPEPVLDKGDLIWCNKKDGTQQLRSRFKGCKTYKETLQ